MKKYTLIATGLAFTMLAATAIAQRSPQRTRTPDATVIKKSLETALAGPSGEYAAFSTYEAVIKKFGQVQPFVSILDAEKRHIAALQTQMQKYGLAVPANPWTNVEVPDSLTEAALLGIEAEEDNIAMYDQLLTVVAAYPDLVKVFSNLQSASEENHLPAFEAASAGTYSSGTCPLAGNGNCPAATASGQTLGKGRGMNGGRGQGNGMGLCDGTGPRSLNGTCPMQTPASVN